MKKEEMSFGDHIGNFKAIHDTAKEMFEPSPIQTADEAAETEANSRQYGTQYEFDGFIAGILASGISVSDMAKMNMVEKFENFKRDFLDDKGYDPELKSGEYITQKFQFAQDAIEQSERAQQPVRKTLDEVKDEVAKGKGYDDWETYENWIIEINLPVNVAVLLVGAMRDAAELYAQAKAVEPQEEIKLREVLEQISKDLTDLRVLALKTLGMDSDSVKIERGLYDIDMKICKALDAITFPHHQDGN